MSPIIKNPAEKIAALKNIFGANDADVKQIYPNLRSVSKFDFEQAWKGKNVTNFYECMQKIQSVINLQTKSEIMLDFVYKTMSLRDILNVQSYKELWDFFTTQILTVDAKLFARCLVRKLTGKLSLQNKDWNNIDDLVYLTRLAELNHKLQTQLEFINPLMDKHVSSNVICLVFCINEGFLIQPWVLTMFLRFMFLNLELQLHYSDSLYASQVMLKIARLVQTYVNDEVKIKKYVVQLFKKQAESWRVESIMCDLFRLIVSFVPWNPAHPEVLGEKLRLELTTKVDSILTEFLKLYPVKYLCFLHAMLLNIRTMFLQDYFKPGAKLASFIQKQKKTSNNIRRRLEFITDDSWYDVYRMIQDKIGNVGQQPQTQEQLIESIEKKLQSPGEKLSQKDAKVYQDHLRLLQLSVKYKKDLMTASNDDEFLFLQTHIRTHFFQYYIPYLNPEYTQQLIHRYDLVIKLFDEFMKTKARQDINEMCENFTQTIKVKIPIFENDTNEYMLYKLLPAFDSVDFDLYDIQGDDMWTQPHFSQQGLNELFRYVSNIPSSTLNHKDETVLNQSHYDLFHLSRTWCKYSYRDYKQICDQVRTCGSNLSPEQNQENLHIIQQCINKRDLYQHSCVYELDQGHSEKLRQLEKTEADCIKSIKTFKGSK